MNMIRTIVCALALGPTLVIAADAPPAAPLRPVTDDYHGTKIIDPYRYMENLADPAVQAWIRSQAEYAGKALASLPQRDALLARIRELDQGAPYSLSVVRRTADGQLFI